VSQGQLPRKSGTRSAAPGYKAAQLHKDQSLQCAKLSTDLLLRDANLSASQDLLLCRVQNYFSAIIRDDLLQDVELCSAVTDQVDRGACKAPQLSQGQLLRVCNAAQLSPDQLLQA
jgi:hypothetical protein